MTKRKHRTLEERIAEEKKKLESLEQKLALKHVEESIENGGLSEEAKAEFATCKKELATIKKAIKVAERHLQDEDVKSLTSLKNYLLDHMSKIPEIDFSEES